MSAPPPWSPTPEQQALLDQQAFVEELFRRRSAPPSPPAPAESATANAGKAPDAPKPAWLRFLESSGGAALITVALGTLGGALITGLIQSSNQRQQARQLSLSEYIEGEHDIVKQAFDLIGQCVAVSENLNIITTNQFDPQRFTGDQRNAVLAQKKSLRDDFNKYDDQWRASRETMTLNMRYYHGNDPALSAAWDKSRDALTTYMDCQHTWYAQHLGGFVEESVAAKACTAERSSLSSALLSLSAALEKTRLYALGAQKS